MQLPETPPPPLAPLWDRVVRARALPPDLDVQLLYVAIRDRLTHPEWEVRLHALRVLADLLPLSGNALAFPFDQVVDNLGHNSPNVRKAALDALKVFCTHCEDPECASRAILDKCYYHNIRPHSAGVDTKINVITGLILSIPSVMSILKRRCAALDMLPVFQILGEKLFDSIHSEVAHRAMMKLRKVCAPRDYMSNMSRLDPKIQEKYQVLCDNYDEDSHDVFYAPRKTVYRNNNNQPLLKINQVFNNPLGAPIRVTTDSSSEDSHGHFAPYYHNNNYAKVIIETEIKFDSDTAITMTVLEENDTESERNTISEDEYDSSDRNMLKYSDDGENADSEDTDVIVKKVRFGGESVKIRTPDSDHLLTSEDDVNQNKIVQLEKDNIVQVPRSVTPELVDRLTESKRDTLERDNKPPKKSGIPLPVIQNKSDKPNPIAHYSKVKLKSKSLNELYDYFRTKNDVHDDRKTKEFPGFSLTISDVRSPEKVPSPVEPHREIEVLHNLQRSPVVSPRRSHTRVHLEKDGFVLSLLATSPPPPEDLVSPRQPTPLRARYEWEELDVVPRYVAEQLHNTENWIAAVKAADQLHSALLEAEAVRKVEPAALSLVKHMWALSDTVSAAKAPAEGAVCALIRGVSSDCARQLLPALISRMAREPLPAALPHALLQRLALHHLVDLIFDPSMIGVTGDLEQVQNAQLRATMCLARAAGPAAVLSAVRRRLAGTSRADVFCNKLRERLSRPLENIKPSYVTRSSQLPVPVRRRARSTPPPAPPQPPRRLRPLPDSAPLLGTSIMQPGRQYFIKTLSPIPLSDRDSSGIVASDEKDSKAPEEKVATVGGNDEDADPTGGLFGDEIVAVPDISRRSASRASSGRVEEYSQKSNPSLASYGDERASPVHYRATDSAGPTSLSPDYTETSDGRRRNPSGKSASPLTTSRNVSPDSRTAITPEPVAHESNEDPPRELRDVRTALAECSLPARHEDWEAIVTGLTESARLAEDRAARAPPTAWRAAARSAAAHVRSLRSRVARAACRSLGALFEHRGRALDPELEEAAAALLDRCADVNRFLRADATEALGRVAAGGCAARAAVALCKRGASHRAGPARAAAAAALSRLVRAGGASRTLALPGEARTLLLRATGELLCDASAEARAQARLLCLALAEDARFKALLKEAMPPTRYRSVEKLVDKIC